MNNESCTCCKSWKSIFAMWLMTHFADITPYTSFPRSRTGILETKLEWSLHPTDVSIFLVMDCITLKNTNNTMYFSVDFWTIFTSSFHKAWYVLLFRFVKTNSSLNIVSQLAESSKLICQPTVCRRFHASAVSGSWENLQRSASQHFDPLWKNLQGNELEGG